MHTPYRPRIGIVGPCTSGKSTLAEHLAKRGYDVRHIAQEHSYVPDMWLKISQPDILIYLSVPYLTTLQRGNLNWTEAEYQEELNRLAHARGHADLVIDTEQRKPVEILNIVLEFLSSQSISG